MFLEDNDLWFVYSYDPPTTITVLLNFLYRIFVWDVRLLTVGNNTESSS